MRSLDRFLSQAINRVGFPKFAAALVVANLIALSFAAAPRAHADHSFQNGTCYVTPEMCQNGYAGSLFYFRVDQFWASPSPTKTNAQPGLTSAMSAWSSVAGPQVFRASTDPNTPANYVFVEEYPAYQPADSVSREALVKNGVAVGAAVTVNHGWMGPTYGTYGVCYDQACLVDYSEVYVSDTWAAHCAGGISSAVYQYIYAHEFGHVLGLDDHKMGGALLMNYRWPSFCYSEAWSTYGINGATSTDIGTATCASPKGVRCICQY